MRYKGASPVFIGSMFKTLFFLSTFLIACANTYAQNVEGTNLFKVTHPDSDKVSYLFGTHHAFGKQYFDSLKIVNQKLSETEVLIKENLTTVGNSSADIINKREETTDWSKYLNKDDLAYVIELFANSETVLDKVTPTELNVLLARIYSMRVCKARTDKDASLSLDDYIETVAKGQEKELIGLETTEEQLEIIRKDVEGMPRKAHKKRLTNTIEQLRSKIWTTSCEQVSVYRNMRFDYAFDMPCQNAVMLTERNNKWMDSILNQLKTKNCFIAVGLSHLMLKCGLVSQLRGMGYIVTPVTGM